MGNGNARKKFKDLNGNRNVTGINIKNRRTQLDISAQHLSDKLIMRGIDVHRQAIFLIEAGKRSVTDYELVAIAEILKTTPNDLLSDFINVLRDENLK